MLRWREVVVLGRRVVEAIGVLSNKCITTTTRDAHIHTKDEGVTSLACLHVVASLCVRRCVPRCKTTFLPEYR